MRFAALILERDGKYLVEQRKSDKVLDPGKVVFPAGKVEPGETVKEALVRESREELGINIDEPYLVHSDKTEFGQFIGMALSLTKARSRTMRLTSYCG